MHRVHGSSSWLALTILLFACQAAPEEETSNGGAGGNIQNAGGDGGTAALGQASKADGSAMSDTGGSGGGGGGGGGTEQKPDASAGYVPDAAPTKTDAMSAAGGSGAGAKCVAKFCDDFESHTLGQAPPAPWSTLRAGGEVLIDNKRAFSGKNSIHAFTTTPSMVQQRAYLNLQGGSVFETAWPVLYGRMMLWLDHNVDAHWSLVEGQGNVSGKNFVAVTRFGGQYGKLIAQYDNVTGNFRTDCAKRSRTVSLPVKTWICYEWLFDSSKNAMRLWVDGKAMDDVSVNGTGESCLSNGTNGNWYLPQYQGIRMGWQNYQQIGPADVWIDDVAIGTERVGCPPKP
jgi:hypothetical protein